MYVNMYASFLRMMNLDKHFFEAAICMYVCTYISSSLSDRISPIMPTLQSAPGLTYFWELPFLYDQTHFVCRRSQPFDSLEYSKVGLSTFKLEMELKYILQSIFSSRPSMILRPARPI